MKVHSISFKANLLKDNVQIQRLNRNGNFIPQDVALVKLDPYSLNDVKSVSEVVYDWGLWESFTFEISENMKEIYDNPFSRETSKKFYALTNQKGGYEKLEPKAILAISQIGNYDSDTLKIDFIETNKKHMYNAKKSKFKHIGMELINCIKNIHENKNLFVRAVTNTETFYEKCGFSKIINDCNAYIFRR